VRGGDMKKIVLFSVLVLLSACGSLGHKFDGLQKPGAEEALIYYYRPGKFWGSGVYYDIEENQKTVTTLYNGGYYPHFTEPGDKRIEASTEAKTELLFTAEKGKTYFVRGKVNMGVLMGRPSLNLVPPEKALREIQECQIIEKD